MDYYTIIDRDETVIVHPKNDVFPVAMVYQSAAWGVEFQASNDSVPQIIAMGCDSKGHAIVEAMAAIKRERG